MNHHKNFLKKILHIRLLLPALCIGILSSCSKSDQAKPKVLNAIENQLLGTWYVKKQVDTQLYYNGSILSTDTSKTYYKTYTGFTAENSITFTSTPYTTTTVAIGNLGLECTDNTYGLSTAAGCATYSGSPYTTFWFYDDADLQQLQIGQAAYYIELLTSDSLVLYFTNKSVPGLVKYNYNWCYLHR